MAPEEEKESRKDQLSLDLNSVDNQTVAKNVELVEDDTILDWVCHPAKKNMKITTLVTLFLFSLLAIVYFWTYSIWFVVLGALILFGSLATFYFPTRYVLSSKNIKIITKAQTQEKKWEQYRTIYPDKNGVLLSPFTRSTRLENFPGVPLLVEKCYNL